MAPMNELTDKQLAYLTDWMARRKALLLDEIRQGLARSGKESFADLIGGTGDAGDEAAASLMRDINEAAVARDIGEVRDIVAAEQRVAAGEYGRCIECGQPIGYKRLMAYPSAKRCLPCQEHREKTRAPSVYTGR